MTGSARAGIHNPGRIVFTKSGWSRYSVNNKR